MEFEVDPDQLATAHRRVGDLAVELSSLLDVAGAVESVLPMVGPTRLVAAMGRVNVAWLRVVEQAVDDLEVLSHRLLLASEEYRLTDELAVGG